MQHIFECSGLQGEEPEPVPEPEKPDPTDKPDPEPERPEPSDPGYCSYASGAQVATPGGACKNHGVDGKCALPTDGRMTDCQYSGGSCMHLQFCDIGQYAACKAGKPESCTVSGGLEGTCEHTTTTGQVSGMQKIFECTGLQEKPGPLPNSLESPAAKGSKELAVVSNAGFDIGVDIVIDAGTPIEEHNKVVGFGSLILASPLQYDHGTGAVITTASSVGSGATASLDAAGFKAVTSLCCPVEMEAFFNRLLDKEGYSVCSKPHIQGLMHWFSCVPDMDFQYMLDVIAKGNPCKYWSPKGTDCPVLSAYCQGEWCR